MVNLRKAAVVLISLLLLFSSLFLGCFDDDGGGKKKSNQAPIADAGVDIEVLSITEIQFDGSNSTDNDGEIINYIWYFDDYKQPGDEISTEIKPSYTYNYPGEYLVTLTVEDDDGATATDTIRITITNRAPIVDIGDDVISETYEVIYFNVMAEDLDGYISSYDWDFDSDGDYDWHATTLGSTTHFYNQPGLFKATIKVTDNLDKTSVKSKNITIFEIEKIPPIAEAGLNQTVPIGQVLFKGTGSDPDGTIVLYEWDFNGDGSFDWSSPETGIAKYDFNTEGEYVARLRVTDDSGLSAIDTVTITVNNSLIAHYVNTEIYIDWNSSYDYIILTNTSVNLTDLDIVISDINSKDEERFDSTDITVEEANKFRINSELTPIPGHTIQIQVIYYDVLIGARNLDIINESTQIISPDIDFSALYDFNYDQTETNVGEVEEMRVTSIGSLEIEQQENLLYSSLKGSGIYYVYDEFEGGESELTLNATELWINTTQSGSNIISQAFSIRGFGKMTTNYDNNLFLEIDILEMKLVTENDVELEEYMYGEGTFYGSMRDPESGFEIQMAGEVSIFSILLGHGKHENYAGEIYECSIYYNNMTMVGLAGATSSTVGIEIDMIMENTTWNADHEKFDNNTIYYEYYSVSTIANQKMYDSGSGYPQGNPTKKPQSLHIEDVMKFETPHPRIFIGFDTMVLESNYGVKLELWVEDESEIIIDGNKYNCVNIKGRIIQGGSGNVFIRLIKDGTFAGLTAKTNQNLFWKRESMKIEETLKHITKI